MANIVHGSSQESQHQFMKEQMDGVARKYNTVTNGKGDKQRPFDVSKFQANYAEINWGSKKPKQEVLVNAEGKPVAAVTFTETKQ